MKPLISVSAFICFLLFIGGCVENGRPVATLEAPRFVPQSQPDSIEETGIGQDPSTGGIFLQWYSVPEATGYRVFCSDTVDRNGAPFLFTPIVDISLSNDPCDTSFVDPCAVVGVTYWYYVQAYVSDAALSTCSDTTCYTLLVRPVLRSPAGNGSVLANNLVFSWADRAGAGFTVLRIRDVTKILPQCVWITPRFSNNCGTYCYSSFNFDGSATAPLISGHIYQWRVDKFNVDSSGRPYDGSRSVWSTFKVK